MKVIQVLGGGRAPDSCLKEEGFPNLRATLSAGFRMGKRDLLGVNLMRGEAIRPTEREPRWDPAPCPGGGRPCGEPEAFSWTG